MSLNWEKQPFRELTRLAWPMAVSMVSYSMMTLVDTLLIGRVGRAELAGVGLGGISAFMLLCFSLGVMQGAKVLVSQAIGANRPGEARAYLAAAVTSALVIGVLIAMSGQLVAGIVARLAATDAAGQAARTYFRLRLLGAPLVLLSAALREVRQAEGDARTPMLATVAANIANTALAVLFIFVLKKGVAGAASATLIAHAVEAGTMMAAQRSRGWGFSSLRRAHISELLRMGVPTGLQFALEVGAFGTLSLIVASLSEVEMASHQIALQVIHFSFLPALAVAEAASVMVGQAVGAGRYELVNRAARLAVLLGAAYSGLCAVVFASTATLIVSGFSPDAAVIQKATLLLHIAAAFQLGDAANIVARCSLRGAGDVRFSATVGVLCSWLCTPTFAYVLGRHYGFGAAGGWCGLCLEIFVSAGLLWWRLERRGWRTAAEAAREKLDEAVVAMG